MKTTTETQQAAQFLHLYTKKNTNGNTPRMYVRLNENNDIAEWWMTWEQSYHCLPYKYREAASRALMLKTTPGELRRIRQSYIQGMYRQ